MNVSLPSIVISVSTSSKTKFLGIEQTVTIFLLVICRTFGSLLVDGTGSFSSTALVLSFESQILINRIRLLKFNEIK